MSASGASRCNLQEHYTPEKSVRCVVGGCGNEVRSRARYHPHATGAKRRRWNGRCGTHKRRAERKP